MWWHYLLVFIGSVLVDIAPFPLPPAFTVMVLLQVQFHLRIWAVVVIGVAGSILGRYVLTLYIPSMASKIFKPVKNRDIQFLGKKLKEKGWKSQLSILVYSLLPLPTTPLFLAAGMAKMRPYYIIPAFFVGKSISDTVAVVSGRFAAESTQSLFNGMVSWKSVMGMGLALVCLLALLFIDWRTVIQDKKLRLRFHIWK